jgi:hypothetical protein
MLGFPCEWDGLLVLLFSMCDAAAVIFVWALGGTLVNIAIWGEGGRSEGSEVKIVGGLGNDSFFCNKKHNHHNNNNNNNNNIMG